MVAALNALQLTATAELLQRFVGFLPTVVTAILVLIPGILAAAFLAATVRTAASNAGIAQAQVLGQFVLGCKDPAGRWVSGLVDRFSPQE